MQHLAFLCHKSMFDYRQCHSFYVHPKAGEIDHKCETLREGKTSSFLCKLQTLIFDFFILYNQEFKEF